MTRRKITNRPVQRGSRISGSSACTGSRLRTGSLGAATTWTTAQQYLIAVKLSYTGGTVDETTAATSTGPVGINVPLTSARRNIRITFWVRRS